MKNRNLQFILIMLVATLLLVSCATHPPKQVLHPVIGETPTHPEDLRGARLFRISPAASTIHILVYRGGTLANLGHNHVISSKSVSGFIWQHDKETSLCGFDIAMPVKDLIVDDNEARAAEGGDFPLDVPDSARQGTQHNMLSEALLDAEQFPVIRLQSANLSGDTRSPRVVAHVTIRDQFHLYSLPVTVESDSHTLHARGEFTIKQTDFGIKPFSVAMGALQVQDELTIKFDLQAEVMD